MEKYIINGKEIEYDTFDLAAMELFDSEVTRVKEEMERIQPEDIESQGYLNILRKQCETVLDFFDTVIGEGTSKTIFGDRVNIKEITEAYRSLCSDVTDARKNVFCTAVPSPVTETGDNRAQRRQEERQKRREEAARRAAIKVPKDGKMIFAEQPGKKISNEADVNQIEE